MADRIIPTQVMKKIWYEINENIVDPETNQEIPVYEFMNRPTPRACAVWIKRALMSRVIAQGVHVRRGGTTQSARGNPWQVNIVEWQKFRTRR